MAKNETKQTKCSRNKHKVPCLLMPVSVRKMTNKITSKSQNIWGFMLSVSVSAHQKVYSASLMIKVRQLRKIIKKRKYWIHSFHRCLN